MPLLINNDVTARVLEMTDAIDALESVLKQYADGRAIFQPRTDLWSPTAKNGAFYRWGSLLGGMMDPPTLALRFKSDIVHWTDYGGAQTEEYFCMEPGTYCGFIILIDMSNGEIIALLNDGVLQHVRVAANAAIGAKYLARKDAHVLGVLGSGGMARAHVEAINAVRKLEEVRVFSPTPAKREKFAEEVGAGLGIPVFACDSARAALTDVDMVATCTDSRVPIHTAEMLELHRPGVFIVRCRPEEIDKTTLDAVDKSFGNARDGFIDMMIGTPEQRAKRPSGKDFERRRYNPTPHPLLVQVISAEIPGRENDSESILYENQSSGLQFAAVGRLVYERAKAAKLGLSLPIEWFLQDIKN